MKAAAHDNQASTLELRWLRRAGLLLLDNAILVALAVAVIVFSIASPDVFFTPTNLISVLRFASLGGIVVAFYTLAIDRKSVVRERVCSTV